MRGKKNKDIPVSEEYADGENHSCLTAVYIIVFFQGFPINMLFLSYSHVLCLQVCAGPISSGYFLFLFFNEELISWQQVNMFTKKTAAVKQKFKEM